MNEMDTRFANQYNIQWFPGHMTKTLRMMEQEIQHVDASLVLLDARIPLSSLNPEIERITDRKPKLYALNKADLADPAVTEEWIRYFHAADAGCVAISAKQKGGRLAKGRLLGIQFLELFRDGLYFRLGAHADRLAVMLRDFCRSRGLSLPFSSGTNQQFVTMPDSVLEELGRKYGFAYLRREDKTHSTVRFCMSWATREEDVRELMADIARLC